ncbi:MAG: hypothetical protein AAGA65_26475 [Actinomycetota bacterium]
MSQDRDRQPDWEDLAAFIDGRIDEDRRRQVEHRLAIDPDYFEVFASTVKDDAVADRGEDRANDGTTLGQSLLWVPAAAVALLALALGLLWPAASNDPATYLQKLSAQEIIATPGWNRLPWSVTLSASEPPRHLTNKQRAFRLGVRTIDLRLTLTAGDAGQAELASQRLAVLSDALGLPGPALFLRDLAMDIDKAEMADLEADVQALEARLVEALNAPVRRHFAAGRWLQVTRLAAIASDEATVAVLLDEVDLNGDPAWTALRAALQETGEQQPIGEPTLRRWIERLDQQAAQLGG